MADRADAGAFALSESPIEPAALGRALAHASAGALATFEGWVRDSNEGRRVQRLEYQSYAALARSEGADIVAEARQRFAIVDARCVHRVGMLAIGDLAVWVGVSAAHRGAAFDACRYIIDEVKRRVPIWKNEHYADGQTGWLHPDNTPVADATRELGS
jgi:molybdopterin synthase catalytic subunit